MVACDRSSRCHPRPNRVPNSNTFSATAWFCPSRFRHRQSPLDDSRSNRKCVHAPAKRVNSQENQFCGAALGFAPAWAESVSALLSALMQTQTHGGHRLNVVEYALFVLLAQTHPQKKADSMFEWRSVRQCVLVMQNDEFECVALAHATAARLLSCARIVWNVWMRKKVKTKAFCRMSVRSYCCSMFFDKKAFACEGFLACWDAISYHCC